VLPAIFQIIQHSVAAYLSDAKDPKLRSDDPALTGSSSVAGSDPNVWFTAGRLLYNSQPNIFAGANFGEDWWEFPINGPMARKMRGIQTIDDYFDRQAEVLAEADRRRTEAMPSAFVTSEVPASAASPAAAFVLMPFVEEWSDGAFQMFKRAAQRINVDPKPRVYRADEIEHSGRITEQIIDAIRTADVVVADVTGLNPNVMWELGYAFALDKEIIIANQEIDESPFDLREWRQVTYSTDFTRDETNSLTKFFPASLGLPESDELSAVDELAELVGDGRYLVTMWEYQPNADSELKVAGWLDGSAVTVHELLGPTAEQVMLVFENQWVRRTPPTSLERDPSVGFWHKAQAGIAWLSSDRITQDN
jgi:hypothetical protein